MKRAITKAEMVEQLLDSFAWNGTRNRKLMMSWSWEELHDAWTQLDEAETEYCEFIYD